MSRRTLKVPADYDQLPQPALVQLVERLLEVLAVLEQENQQLKRAAKRQAAPFTKGKKPGRHKRPGRKPGRGPFSHRRPPQPDQITDRQTVPAPQSCPNCGHSDLELTWEDAYTTELPEPHPTVKHIRRPACRCRRCRHHWRAPHPDLADDQWGATAHRLGPRLRCAAHVLHYRIGLPVRKVPLVLKELHNIDVTQSALTQDALRTARVGPLRERYQQIKEGMAKAPVVHTDPTGWRKAGQPAALIAFATPDTPQGPGQTLYHVRDHHGADEVIEVLGPDFQGVLSTDRGPEYDSKKLDTQRKQKCNTHIKRNIRKVLDTQAVPSARRFGEQLRSLLDEARKLRRSYDRGHRRGYQTKVANLEARMTHFLRPRKLTDPDNQRLLDQLGRQHRSGHVLRFLHDTTLSPDNHLAEQQIRPAVIARKVSHCSKNDAGADARGVHSTVYQTENRAQRFEKPRGSIIDRVINFFKPRSSASQAHAPSTAPP